MRLRHRDKSRQPAKCQCQEVDAVTPQRLFNGLNNRYNVFDEILLEFFPLDVEIHVYLGDSGEINALLRSADLLTVVI